MTINKTYQAVPANPEDLAIIEKYNGEIVFMLPDHKTFNCNTVDFDILKAFAIYLNLNELQKTKFNEMFNEIKNREDN